MTDSWIQTTRGHSTVYTPGISSDRKPGTPQQEDFYAQITTSDEHVILEARAGTGKSTSCAEGMRRLLERDRNRKIRYATFSKALADEFKAKAPEGAEIATLHAFGLKALSRSSSVTIDKHKTYLALDSLPGGMMLARSFRSNIAKLVSAAKNAAVNPLQGDEDATIRQLIELATWFEIEADEEDLEDLAGWTLDVLIKSAQQTSLIDFDDMIWLPIILGTKFPACSDLVIDEAQDLNPTQHKLVTQMARAGRLIAVGDPYQSIYAFRGADADSMPKLTAMLSAVTLPLTVTWRCPHSHVDLARRIVPDFEAAPTNKRGSVEYASAEMLPALVHPGDLVLCRSNAPLVRECLSLIARRIPAIVRGRQIGDQLAGVVAKLRAPRTMPEFRSAVQRWKAREIEKLSSREGCEDQVDAVSDRAACLDAVADSCSSPAEVLSLLQTMFTDVDAGDRVTFSTIHRAKGSEADRVHLITVPYKTRDKNGEPAQVPQWQAQARANLEYVALTRSKSALSILRPER